MNPLTREHHRAFGTSLGKKARIETVYENGKITSMMIFLNGVTKQFLKKLHRPESNKAFINTIENRLKSEDYIDERPGFLDDFELYTSRAEDVLKASRIVATTDFDILFHWRKG